jgi:hypothetical protein
MTAVPFRFMSLEVSLQWRSSECFCALHLSSPYLPYYRALHTHRSIRREHCAQLQPTSSTTVQLASLLLPPTASFLAPRLTGSSALILRKSWSPTPSLCEQGRKRTNASFSSLLQRCSQKLLNACTTNSPFLSCFELRRRKPRLRLRRVKSSQRDPSALFGYVCCARLRSCCVRY